MAERTLIQRILGRDPIVDEESAPEDSVESLKAEIRDLQDEKKVLKLEHKMQMEETKHLVKLKEERLKDEYERKEHTLEVDYQKKELELRRECDQNVAEVRDEYRVKMEEALKEQMDGIREMYGQIVEQLPDVNYAIQHDIGSGKDSG